VGKTAYLVASRQGIYLADRAGWRQLAEGRFFGIVCVGDEVFAFRHGASARPVRPLSGRVVRYAWTGGELRELGVVATGLDYSCHQLDFFDGAFFLVDTANQSVLEYRPDWMQVAAHAILPPADPDGPDHAHLNSITGNSDTVWVMLHNEQRGRPSEILELDRGFRERRRTALPCSGCHEIVPLADGRLLTCLSPRGELAVIPGEAHRIDPYWTRGLVVSPDETVVGSSLFGQRLGRALLPGFLTFLNPDYSRSGRLYLPAAPTQIRRVEVPG
jgi:hypothetical protein